MAVGPSVALPFRETVEAEAQKPAVVMELEVLA